MARRGVLADTPTPAPERLTGQITDRVSELGVAFQTTFEHAPELFDTLLATVFIGAVRVSEPSTFADVGASKPLTTPPTAHVHVALVFHPFTDLRSPHSGLRHEPTNTPRH